VKDVFLDEFADTDEEVEMDEEETERQMRKEERRKVSHPRLFIGTRR
jgi:vacuolar protein sorting-associated protein 72